MKKAPLDENEAGLVEMKRMSCPRLRTSFWITPPLTTVSGRSVPFSTVKSIALVLTVTYLPCSTS